MVLNPNQAIEQTQRLLEWHESDRKRLDRLHQYLRGTQPFIWLPSGTPQEVRRIAEMSRIPVPKFVVDSVTQSMYVDGYRSREDVEDQPAWDLWQRNKLDSRQTGIHRAMLAYGVSYMTVLPGDPVPVMRGASPRKLTAVYGQDDDWPMWALERRRQASGSNAQLYRLFDEEAVYWVGQEEDGELVFISHEIHDIGVVPVVRYLNVDDLDDEIISEIDPIVSLVDQINMTTFGLLVAQHYGAFRQRYIIGWLAESEQEAVSASARKLWTFDADDPNDVQVGEFDQTRLDGYIDSREASLRHLATISQTPVHELLGQLVNLSAEALAAARDSHNRKITERQVLAGEAHEQALGLGSRLLGVEPDPSAWVRWRDMEARSMSQMADALGKLVNTLGVPPEALWEKIPGVTQQEIEEWKALSAEGGAIAGLESLLERQMGDF